MGKFIRLFSFLCLLVILSTCKKNSESNPVIEDTLSSDQLKILDNAPLDKTSIFSDMLFPNGNNISDWGKVNDIGYVNDFSKSISSSGISDKKLLFIKRMTEAGIRLADDALCSCYPTQPNGLAYVFGSKNITFTIINEASICKEPLWGLDCSGLIYQMALGSSINLPEGGTINYVLTSLWNKAFNNSPDYQNLEMKDLSYQDPSQFEAGDLIVEPGKHIGMVYNTGTTLGIINSQGSPDLSCTENSKIGRGPVLRSDITTTQWIKFLFPNNDYHVLRVVLNGVPGLATDIVTSISPTSAISGGNITNEGGSSVISRGVCWGTLENPTILNNKTIDGSGIGSFNSNLTGLLANTLYYVRAYATNSLGTAYGNQVSFTTQGNPSPNINNTTWDVTIFFNSTTSWHADITFYVDGTMKYDEPANPGLYLTYGVWSLNEDKIHWTVPYVFDGTISGVTMSGTFVYGTQIKNWSAVKR